MWDLYRETDGGSIQEESNQGLIQGDSGQGLIQRNWCGITTGGTQSGMYTGRCPINTGGTGVGCIQGETLNPITPTGLPR